MTDNYNPMFRYLERYVGTYRVLSYYDIVTKDFPRDKDGLLDSSFDDLYIPCKKGLIKHTYEVDKLMWYCDTLKKGRSVKAEIDKVYGNKLPYTYEETSEEVMIFFDAHDMSKIAKLVSPKTTGKNIQPYSEKNLPAAEYKIPANDEIKYDELLKMVPKEKRLVFSRSVIRDFDKIITKNKGKRFNLEDRRTASGLKPKVFIHYIGMWDEFLKFIKKEIKDAKFN